MMHLKLNIADILNKYILPLLAVVYTYFAPTVYWIAAVGFFIFSDFALRTLIILRSDPKQFVSYRAWKTVYKFGMGAIFIVVAHVAQQLFVPDFPLMKILGSFLILVELKSIDEKAKEATGYSLFSLVIEKIMPKKN